MASRSGQPQSFNLREGKLLAKKYEVLQRVGAGWEGEVYLVREVATDIERAAKLFFPKRNPSNRTLKFYAKKLHALRHCPILIQYHARDVIEIDDEEVPILISEYVDGELLSEYLKRQPGGRLTPYQALHLLYALVRGVEEIHRSRDYHGDIHAGNIIVSRVGLTFELKLIDVFRWSGASKPENIQDDIVNIVNVFYDALGGKDRYSTQPDWVKEICSGLKRSLILKKFRSLGKLRAHLETIEI